MQLFPKRSPEDKREDVMGWVWTTVFLVAVAALCIGLFAFSGGPSGESTGSWWGNLRWIALLVGAIAGYLAIQSVFSLLVAVTVGPERFIAGFIVLMAIGGLLKLLAGE